MTVEYELDESEVKGKTGGSDSETTGSDHEKHISGHENPVSVDVNRDFDVLMGAYRNDFRDNARKVLSAIADEPEIDTKRLMQRLGISENSVWRAIRAMKEVGIIRRVGPDKGGHWEVVK